MEKQKETKVPNNVLRFVRMLYQGRDIHRFRKITWDKAKKMGLITYDGEFVSLTAEGVKIATNPIKFKRRNKYG